jgi:hypothetical protein
MCPGAKVWPPHRGAAARPRRRHRHRHCAGRTLRRSILLLGGRALRAACWRRATAQCGVTCSPVFPTRLERGAGAGGEHVHGRNGGCSGRRAPPDPGRRQAPVSLLPTRAKGTWCPTAAPCTPWHAGARHGGQPGQLAEPWAPVRHPRCGPPRAAQGKLNAPKVARPWATTARTPSPSTSHYLGPHAQCDGQGRADLITLTGGAIGRLPP